MRIYIKEKEGKTFFIPAPLSLACFCLNLSTSIINIFRKHLTPDTQKYIDCVDFKMLSKSLRELRYYKGLVLVDIKTKDGLMVKIKI